MRKVDSQSNTLTYLIGDHLGSTSLVLNSSGGLLAETRYKPWGEVRYTTPNSTLPTRYTFTGQYSYLDDPSTSGVTEGFGLMFYNARWYDPALGRFAQPDTLIPEQSQGTHAWDRYAYVNNNPLRYNDPSGHCIETISCLLTWIGVLPDVWGVMRAAVFINTNDATVMAGIAVQSQWLGPQDLPAVTAVYDAITGTDPNSHNYGWAQTNSNEVEGNPWDPNVAVQAMEKRFSEAWAACKRCETGVDRLVVYALAQNGFDAQNFRDKDWGKDLSGNMDWNYFLGTYGKNPSAPSAQIRQGLTGLNYETQFMLKLYIQDLELLLWLGYDLPTGITQDDIAYVKKHYLNFNNKDMR